MLNRELNQGGAELLILSLIVAPVPAIQNPKYIQNLRSKIEMPEWDEQISRLLANLKLTPTREAEILEELSQHLEDRYRELLAALLLSVIGGGLGVLVAFFGLGPLISLAAQEIPRVEIYGVVSFSTGQRTREIGIRLALGAQKSDVLKMILGSGIELTMLGVVLGLIAAFALTRLMETLLFAVTPTDPLTFTLMALSLAGVGLLACYVPARRATKVDPIVTLRYE